MTSQGKQLICEELFEAFPKNDPPAADGLTSVRYDEESQQVRISFDGVAWWSASNDLIDANFDKLPLLTPEAFHYYLPAFLLRSLDRFERDNLVLEFTVYSLSPTKTSRTDEWYGARLELFTPEQVSVIRKFLDLILADEAMYAFYESAGRALRKFWNSDEQT